MYEAFQIIGSLLVLVPFVAVALNRLAASSVFYLALNAVGSGILTVTAVMGREWGFLLLEGVWALVSVHSLLRRATGHPVTPVH